MGAITREAVMEQLRTVNDPELHRDLVTLNMIKEVAIEGGRVRVHVELTTPACPLKDQIGRDVEQAVKRVPGVQAVELQWSAQVRASRTSDMILPGVKNIIAVGAGKGGVGKSTAAVLLAVGLRRAGASVGLLDADVYGPSIPTLVGIEDAKPAVRDKMIVPVEAWGLKVMSVGFMIQRDQPLVLRGPMLHGIIRQFLEQVDWGDLDYLIVDLPPGTGDVPLTLGQSLRGMTGAVMVCTPQDVALIDCRRAIKMYDQLNIPCLGIIENMSYYLCPHCGNRDELFDHGGAADTARDLGVPFLGEIPLNANVRRFGDAGSPERVFTDTDDYVQQAVNVVVSNLAGQVSIKSQLTVQQPTLTVE
jgi:ATP-binding protein involved in chromosome partitioning